MKITNFEVSEREIKKLGDNKLVGLVNQDKFVINFRDADWNGLHKSFKLQRSDKKVVNLPLDLEDSVILSQECYLEGWSKLWFEGTINEDTPEELIVALTEPLEIYFSPRVSGDIVPIGIPKPSEWDIIIGQMNKVKEDILGIHDELDTKVNEVITHLNNGEYDGRGIVSIDKIRTEGLEDTYQISYTDDTKSQIIITNGANGKDGERGVSILDITKTSTSGLVDTYTISYSDGTTSEFKVTNGRNGVTPSLDGYATEEYVDRKINDSITNMLGGAY